MSGGVSSPDGTVVERAPAKVNLILRVGAPAASGLHPIASVFARLELADEVRVTPAGAGADEVVCAGVEGPNLAGRALDAFRAAAGGAAVVPPLRVEIHKRIPVAAGLGGGSADAAATLRAAARLTGAVVEPSRLRALALQLGSDVPSQLEPAHAIVTGEGDGVERVALATMGVVLIPDDAGLSTAAVYAELDRLRGGAPVDAAGLDPAPLREATRLPTVELAERLHNDLQPAALTLRPDLTERLAALAEAGALASAISGSGPTTYGLFEDRAAAATAAATIPGAVATEIA